MTLDKYISELLEEHDCVIVPNFGGFVANYAPARINPVNDRFDPPYRKVSFNKFLVHNDGLLAAYIARKEEEQYEESVKNIKNYVLYLKQELRDQKRVSIDTVGIIYLQQDGSFRFEQVKNSSFFKSGFGLESFFASAIERVPVQQVSIDPKAQRKETIPAEELPKVIPMHAIKTIEKVEEKKTAPIVSPALETESPIESEQQTEDTRKRRYWPAVAALIGLPILGYSLWLAIGTPLLRNRSEFQTSDLNPFGEKIESSYTSREKAFIISTFESIEAPTMDPSIEYLEIEIENAPDKTLVVKLSPENSGTSATQELKYHIIGGCFSVEDNATGLAETYRNKGTNASVIDVKGNLHRVSLASYATKKEAKAALASFKNEIPGAWVLYK